MKKFIFLSLVGLFLYGDIVCAMDSTQFRVLEDLSQENPTTVRRRLKTGFTEIVLGGGLVVFSPHVPSLGSKNLSRPVDYDLVSPTTIKVFGKTLVLNGARKFISAAHEEYNIFRGSRLSPNERTLSHKIRNGVVDLGLASLVYIGHQYIPTLLMESYVELAGPAVTVIAVSCLGMRGITDLARDIPTWAGDLDWSVAVQNCIGKVSEYGSVFSSYFTKKPEERTK